MSDKKAQKHGPHDSTQSLGPAIQWNTEPSTLPIDGRSLTGERMHAAWVEFKRVEWQDYCKHVSDWEVRRYLRQFG